MKQKFLKLFAGVIAFCMLFTAMLTVEASNAATPVISASSVTAESGKTVNVVISLQNNPGLWGIGLKVGYDHSALTLTGCAAGNVFTADEITPPPSLNKETYFFVASKEGLADTTANGTLVTLTFSVAANAAYKEYPITLTLDKENTINAENDNVAISTTDGKITVAKHQSPTWMTVIRDIYSAIKKIIKMIFDAIS